MSYNNLFSFGGITTATGTSPIQINGVSGLPQTGDIVISSTGGGGGGGVTQLTGTNNQVLVNGGSGVPVTGSILLALPQSIGTTNSVQFGQLGVGLAPQTDLDLSISRASSSVNIRSRNTNTTANSDAVLILQTSNGSPYTIYINNLTNYFCVGLDANNSFRFKFSGSGSLGTTDVMSMDTASVAINNQLVIGSITPQGNTQLTLNPTGQYGIFASSTMSLASANLYGIRLNNIYSPSTAFSTHGYAFTGVFNAVSGRTIPNAYAFYSDITLSAAGGTVTSTYNFYAGGGSSTASTATNVYGFYNLALTFGTNRYGAYHTAPSGGSIAIACYTDNLSVGYNVTPPASGAIISGSVGLGTSAPSASSKIQIVSTLAYNTYFSGTQTADDGANVISLLLASTLSPATTNRSTVGIYVGPTHIAGAGNTIIGASGIFVSQSFSGNAGTITNAYNILVNPGVAGGTITNGYGLYLAATGFGTTRYGLYVAAPTGGTTNYAAFIDNVYVNYQNTFAVYIAKTLTAASGTVSSLNVAGSLGATASNTLSDAESIYCYPNFGSNAGTINTAAGLYVGGGATAGTITAGYGILVAAIGYGTTRYGLYVSAPTGGTTNYGYQLMGQGSFNTSPGNSSVISMGSGAFTRTLYVTGTQSPASGAAYAIQFEYTVAPVAGNSAYTMVINTSFQSPAGGLNACAGYYANIACTGSGTITEASSILIDNGVVVGPTVTTGYGVQIKSVQYGSTRIGLSVSMPNGGSTNICASFADNTAFFSSLGSFGGGSKVLSIANCSVVPSSNPSGGGVLYSDAGALKWRGSSGTVTTIANA